MNSVGYDESSNKQILLNDYFNKAADYWSLIYERGGVREFVHQERFRILLELVDSTGLTGGARVLDAGCGAGLAAVALAQRGYSVEAMDPAPEMVRLTRERARKAGLAKALQTSIGSINSLPYREDTFDLIVSMGVLSWLPSSEAAISEMSRVLKPDGYLVVNADNGWGLCWLLDPLTNPLIRPLKDRAKHLLVRAGMSKPSACSRPISPSHIDGLLAANNLDKIAGLTLGFGPLNLFRRPVLPSSAGLKLHRTLQRLADRGVPIVRSTGSQYVVLAKKRVTSAA